MMSIPNRKTTKKEKRRTANMRSPFFRSVFLLMLFGASLLHAQVNTASLSGLATDPRVRRSSECHRKVTDQGTGYTRTVQTDGAGRLFLAGSAHRTV